MKILAVVLLLVYPIPAHAQKALPDSPKPNKPVFFVGTSLLAAAKTADAWSTRNALDGGAWENNPVFGRYPSNARLAAVNAAFFSGEMALFFKTEHSHHAAIRWAGRAYVGFVIANHAQLAACNLEVHPLTGRKQNCHDLLPF